MRIVLYSWLPSRTFLLNPGKISPISEEKSFAQITNFRSKFGEVHPKNITGDGVRRVMKRCPKGKLLVIFPVLSRDKV
jgi:hypothetical protein